MKTQLFSYLRNSAQMIFAVAAVLYLSLALPKVNQAVTDDEVYEIENAHRLLEGRQITVLALPLYDLILAGSIAVVGPMPWSMRLPGVVSALATLWLVICIMQCAGCRSRTAVLAAALGLAVNPAFVQGSLLVTVDNTILVPLILLWLLCILRYLHDGTIASLASCSFVLFFALMAKFSTPILILPAVTIFILVIRPSAVLRFVIASVAALLAFLIVWVLVSHMLDVPFRQPFEATWYRVALYSRLLTASISVIGLNLITLAVWFTPYFLLISLVSTFCAIRRPMKDHSSLGLLAVAALSVFAYFFVSTINHGFPKYFMPMLPLLFCVVALHLFDGNEPALSARVQWGLGMLVIVLTLLFTVFAADPVYLVRFSLREMRVLGVPLWNLVPTAIANMGLLVLPLLAYALYRISTMRRRTSTGVLTAARFLALLAFSYGFALSIKQAAASYQTNYSYGERGSEAVCSYLAQRLVPTDRIIATKDILYRINRRNEYIGPDVWCDPAKLSNLLRQRDTRCLVVSIPSVSVDTLKMLSENPQICANLSAHYAVTCIGTYTIYSRNDHVPD
jgi:hypothetical protein